MDRGGRQSLAQEYALKSVCTYAFGMDDIQRFCIPDPVILNVLGQSLACAAVSLPTVQNISHIQYYQAVTRLDSKPISNLTQIICMFMNTVLHSSCFLSTLYD